MAEPAPETQRVGRVFVGVDRGSPNGDQPAYTEMEQQPDGSMLVTKCLVGDEARKEIERREARPAMDLKGLALQFRHAINPVGFSLERVRELCEIAARAMNAAESSTAWRGASDGIKAAVRAVLGDIGGTVACQRCGGYSEDSANCEGMAEGHGGPCEPPNPAACDVEALAKVITYVLEMRSALADDPQLRKVAQDIAETTLSHVGAELAAVRSQLDGARDGRDLYFKLYEKEKSKADAYQKDWYAAKSEFGDAMGKMRDKVRELEAERDGARNELAVVREDFARVSRENADLRAKVERRTALLFKDFDTSMEESKP